MHNLVNSNVSVMNIINSLSFDEYVLIDCLKFSNLSEKNKETFTTDYFHLHNVYLVALTRKGFLKIFEELLSIFKKKSKIEIYDDQLVFIQKNAVFAIRYTDKDINSLISLPCLDFYKCYYDGVKVHSTSEAVQCHRTGKVQYEEKLMVIPSIANSIFNCEHLIFKDGFWENTNKEFVIDYVVPKLGHKKVVMFNHEIYERNCFSEKIDYESCNKKKALFGSCYISTIDISNFNIAKETLYRYIELKILKNPISNL
jgi:hypothetical protein